MISDASIRATNIFLVILMVLAAATGVQAMLVAKSSAAIFLFAMTACIFGICAFALGRIEVMQFIRDHKEKKQ